MLSDDAIIAGLNAVAPTKFFVRDSLLAVRPFAERYGALETPLRMAHLLGQTAHESGCYTYREENLYYSTGERIWAVFGRRHFDGLDQAKLYAKNPQKLANRVYGNRMGNGGPETGDGYRYRGRGWLQLTGRDNYREYGQILGIDLEGQPEKAANPETAWMIAIRYFFSRKRSGRTLFEWADFNNHTQVTRGVNGGVNGLADRVKLTVRALDAMTMTS